MHSYMKVQMNHLGGDTSECVFADVLGEEGWQNQMPFKMENDLSIWTQSNNVQENA